VGLAVAVAALVAAPALAAAPPAPPERPGLPAPFDAWHVTVDHGHDPHVEWVSFDSAVLGRRATMRVVVPDLYGRTSAPLPVVYYLHGTIRIGTSPVLDQLFDLLADQGADLGYPFGPGSAHDEAGYLVRDADRLGFLAVSPDAETSEPWCEHCAWVDGRNGAGVDAERHLYEEVLPLTQALFRVRTDRAGRGIMGASMGAAGALIQASRHPDLFSVVAALSPPMDYLYDAPYADLLWALYLREQGYEPAKVFPIGTRAVNPADLVSNLRGEGIDTIITVGEGCVAGAGKGECRTASFADQPIDALQEILIRHQDDLYVPAAIASGVPISYLTYDGVHFVVNGDVFERHLLDRMNHDLAVGTPVPASVTFRSADPSFSLWGWEVALQRPNQEFVTVDARPDGTALAISGSGVLHLRSPAVFAPGSLHRVTVAASDAGRPTTTRTLRAGPDGRVQVGVDLGVRHPLDEVGPLAALGVVRSPQTRITIAPS
jgi:hypothetical protein